MIKRVLTVSWKIVSRTNCFVLSNANFMVGRKGSAKYNSNEKLLEYSRLKREQYSLSIMTNILLTTISVITFQGTSWVQKLVTAMNWIVWYTITTKWLLWSISRLSNLLSCLGPIEQRGISWATYEIHNIVNA